jgi:hypothetical protein
MAESVLPLNLQAQFYIGLDTLLPNPSLLSVSAIFLYQTAY